LALENFHVLGLSLGPQVLDNKTAFATVSNVEMNEDGITIYRNQGYC